MLTIEPFFVVDMLSHRVDFLSLVSRQLLDHLNHHHHHLLVSLHRHHHHHHHHHHHRLVSHHLRLDLNLLINSFHLINFDFVNHLYYHHLGLNKALILEN